MNVKVRPVALSRHWRLVGSQQNELNESVEQQAQKAEECQYFYDQNPNGRT